MRFIPYLRVIADRDDLVSLGQIAFVLSSALLLAIGAAAALGFAVRVFQWAS